MSLSTTDTALLQWVGSIYALEDNDTAIPCIRTLVRKRSCSGAPEGVFSDVFTRMISDSKARIMIFHYLNLLRVQQDKLPLEELAGEDALNVFFDAAKTLQENAVGHQALSEAQALFSFIHGDNPDSSVEVFKKLVSLSPDVALSVYRMRRGRPSDRFSLVRAAALGDVMAILRLADTSPVPERLESTLMNDTDKAASDTLSKALEEREQRVAAKEAYLEEWEARLQNQSQPAAHDEPNSADQPNTSHQHNPPDHTDISVQHTKSPGNEEVEDEFFQDSIDTTAEPAHMGETATREPFFPTSPSDLEESEERINGGV